MNRHFDSARKAPIAGCIEDIKNQIKNKISNLVRDSNKNYSMSLLGIGDALFRNKKLDGKYQIKLLANNFKGNRNYLVEIRNNRIGCIKEGTL